MADKIITDIITRIDDAILAINKSIPGIQRQIFDDVTLLVKDLDISPDGTIKNNVTNLKIIGRIRSKLEEIILNRPYLKSVEDFASAFDDVAKLQNKYFRSLESKYKPKKLLGEISKQAISWTIDSLTEAGIGANVTDEIEDLLRRNITTGGSYKDLVSQLRDQIISNKSGQGLLERYVKQVTTDSIQQYNRQYSLTVADDLGFTWFMYVGSNIKTTREWCLAMTEKKYIHRSELPEVINGDIDGNQVKINKKTGLWYGAIEGTNTSNILIYAGGYQCGHQFQPVSSVIVPLAIRQRVEG